jgi:hypothetical protein
MFGNDPEKGLQRMLGILNDEKRIYRFVDGEVSREEFEQCVLIDQVVFGPKGYVESIGPTWDLIHDPRFISIEGKFIIPRRGRLGGDATLGRQYISGVNQFTSSIVDLEQYSEILGEGRNFFNFLQHPEPECPERQWLERVWKRTFITAGPNVVCLCKPEEKLDPRTWKDQPDEVIWTLIRREWPNYFRQNGSPNREATRLFDLCKADLVGLIADYAETPLADDWVVVDAEDAANKAEAGLQNEVPTVAMEVDFLEKALTYRAALRATATKVLSQIGFIRYLRDLNLEDVQLTDMEADAILRMVYQSNYPEGKSQLIVNLVFYLQQVILKPYPERLKEQTERASEKAQVTIRKLKEGTLQPVNQVTDAEPEDQRTVLQRYEDFCKMMEQEGESPVPYDVWYEESYKPTVIFTSIFKSPLKKDLYLIYTMAENQLTERNATEEIKALSQKVIDILKPVFDDPHTLMDEEKYSNLMKTIKETGYFELGAKEFSEEFHSKESGKPVGTEVNRDALTVSEGKTLEEVWTESLDKLGTKKEN